MPKLTKSVPSYRKHKKSGQAVVTLDGRDFYLGKHETPASRAEYDRLIGEWLANGRRLPPKQQSRTVEELIDAYWQFARRYYRRPDGTETTELDAYKQALKPLRRLYGTTCVEDFGPLALKSIRQWMVDQKYARTHINHQINRIRRVFKWGVENELVSGHVLEQLRAVAGLKRGRSDARETEPVTTVPEDYVEAVKPYVSEQVWAMIELQRLTAMRSGEVTTMRGCDLNMSGKVWEYRPAAHKMTYRGQERVILVGPRAQEVIRPFLKPNLEEYLFSPKEAETARHAKRRAARKSPMTPSQAGRKPKGKSKRPKRDRYSSQSYGRAIVYGLRKAEEAARESLSPEEREELEKEGRQLIPHWHPHQLRHNAATWIRREFGLEVAQIILGHTSADVTQVYAEVNHAKAVQVMERVG